jgi:hypothetical protein
MKRMSPKQIGIAAAAAMCAASLSIGWSQQGGVSLLIDSAQARVGRPLTPVSVAGVARRTARRNIYAAPVVVAPACVRVLANGAYVCR